MKKYPALMSNGFGLIQFAATLVCRWRSALTALVLLVIASASMAQATRGQVAATFGVVPSTSMSGLWWNQNESGWGMSLTQQGPVIFVAWYSYDDAGKPMWLVMSSCAITESYCSGDIYRVAGGTALGQQWSGAGKLVSKVGTGKLSFSDSNNASFNFSLNGASGTKTITRQVFATGATPPATDYSALWWNPDESGWGVALTQQYGTIFATLYTYDALGNPVWYVASACSVSGSGCTGDLYQVSGGSAPSVPWNGANKATAKVGSISFVFSDDGNAVMHYQINGAAGSKSISKQVFYTEPASGPESAYADCFDTALLTTGTSWQIDYESSISEAALTYSITSTVNGPATFNGYSAIEVQEDQVMLSGPESGATTSTKYYGAVTDSSAFRYGAVITTFSPTYGSGSGINTYSPPIQTPLKLPLNTPYTQTYNLLFGPSSVYDLTITDTTSFLGTESITVPAGTFSACKIKADVKIAGESGTLTAWTAASGPYRGFLLKTMDQKNNLSVATKLLFKSH